MPAGHAEQPVAPEAAAMVPAAQTVQPLVSVPSVEYCPAGQVPKRRNGADAAVTRSAWPTMGRAPPKWLLSTMRVGDTPGASAPWRGVAEKCAGGRNVDGNSQPPREARNTDCGAGASAFPPLASAAA